MGVNKPEVLPVTEDEIKLLLEQGVELGAFEKEEPELETCFEALYGLLLLRLQKKPVSEGTMKAVEAISSFLSMLANYYDKDLKGELKLDE